MNSVPDTVGNDVPGAGGKLPEPVEAEGPSLDDPIAALMAKVAFEEQDVKDTLCEFFDFLAERFESDHWKLTDRQLRMLGRPAAQLLNSVWAKLQVYIPDILSRWCETTPGATAFLMACGIVVVPKVTKQVKISRDRKAGKSPSDSILHQRYTPPPQPISIREAEKEAAQNAPKRGGMIWQQAPME